MDKVIDNFLSFDDISGETIDKTALPLSLPPNEDKAPEPSLLQGTFILIKDEEGRQIAKNIEDATSDEFLSWMYSVLPLPLDPTMPKDHFTPIKRKLIGWGNIVRAHETRFLFGAGRPRNKPQA